MHHHHYYYDYDYYYHYYYCRLSRIGMGLVVQGNECLREIHTDSRISVMVEEQ